MGKNTKDNAGKQAFIPVMRELVRAYQAFSLYDAAGYRDVELTPPQAEVIFSLGNTSGLSFRAIGDLTLITKGTLTGVIDRLVVKGLVERVPHVRDRRSTLVRLTPAGEQVFAIQFPRQMQHLKQCFGKLGKKERKEAIAVLKKLRELFE
jgi:MarR family 2-MHQ and catechol resistance regulon transcriptional repressor